MVPKLDKVIKKNLKIFSKKMFLKGLKNFGKKIYNLEFRKKFKDTLFYLGMLYFVKTFKQFYVCNSEKKTKKLKKKVRVYIAVEYLKNTQIISKKSDGIVETNDLVSGVPGKFLLKTNVFFLKFL